MPSYKTYRGLSKKGVPDAIEKAIDKAVKDYEKDWGIPPKGKSVRLRVVDIQVTVTNPVRDYVVTLGPGG